MNNEKTKASRRNMGPNRINEKPKNFGKSLKKMTSYMKSLLPILFVALVLSSLSSICSIVGPDKLKELTNELSVSLTINEDNLIKITSIISEDLSEENIKNIVIKTYI